VIYVFNISLSDSHKINLRVRVFPNPAIDTGFQRNKVEKTSLIR